MTWLRLLSEGIFQTRRYTKIDIGGLPQLCIFCLHQVVGLLPLQISLNPVLLVIIDNLDFANALICQHFGSGLIEVAYDSSSRSSISKSKPMFFEKRLILSKISESCNTKAKVSL